LVSLVDCPLRICPRVLRKCKGAEGWDVQKLGKIVGVENSHTTLHLCLSPWKKHD
jgi:hypothetical protein